jgi:hypothetical protein
MAAMKLSIDIPVLLVGLTFIGKRGQWNPTSREKRARLPDDKIHGTFSTKRSYVYEGFR